MDGNLPSSQRSECWWVFLQHFCKLVIDPVSNFITFYSYPHDDHKLEFAKLVHTGAGDYKIDRIILWFSKALLSYLGNFNFKDSHFNQIPSGLLPTNRESIILDASSNGRS